MKIPDDVKEKAKPKYFKKWPDLYNLAVSFGVEAPLALLEFYHTGLEKKDSNKDKRLYLPKIKTVSNKIREESDGELEKEGKCITN